MMLRCSYELCFPLFSFTEWLSQSIGIAASPETTCVHAHDTSACAACHSSLLFLLVFIPQNCLLLAFISGVCWLGVLKGLRQTRSLLCLLGLTTFGGGVPLTSFSACTPNVFIVPSATCSSSVFLHTTCGVNHFSIKAATYLLFHLQTLKTTSIAVFGA